MTDLRARLIDLAGQILDGDDVADELAQLEEDVSAPPGRGEDLGDLFYFLGDLTDAATDALATEDALHQATLIAEAEAHAADVVIRAVSLCRAAQRRGAPWPAEVRQVLTDAVEVLALYLRDALRERAE